jgi:hypothetical protein
MYYAFSSEFMNQWQEPKKVEEQRQKELEEKHAFIMEMNMKNLEKCIKKNTIDELDRTKLFDKTFICDNFFAKSAETNLYDEKEMYEFAKIAEPNIKELGLDYTNKKGKIFENRYLSLTEYKFPVDVIPKNTFTNIATFLVFRISNSTENITPAQWMKHITSS